MYLKIEEVCLFGKCSPSSRNFVEGERLLNAGHLIRWGKVQNNQLHYDVMAFCLQTSGLKNAPHTIKGEISQHGKIIRMGCTCKAGLSEKCKHVLAFLLCCTRNNISEFEVLPCTDTECEWKNAHGSKVEEYANAPLHSHKCFEDMFSKKRKIVVSDEVAAQMNKILFSNPLSAAARDKNGRHSIVNVQVRSQPDNASEIHDIINHPTSAYLEELALLPIPQLNTCCKVFLERFNKDPLSVCLESSVSLAEWKKERQFRMTGSRCYSIYTYCSNKKPDWKSKAIKYFYPTAINNKYVKHGLENESAALKAYKLIKQLKVIKCGLVVCKQNSWIGYSPDGIICQRGVPCKLIEVKCPFEGSKKPILEVVKNLNWITTLDSGDVTVNSKHQYYGQIQFGMAVLNVKETDFIIYCTYNQSLCIIPVCLDENFVKKMLLSLKTAYFNNMIHYVCNIEERSGGSIEE